MRVQRFYEIRVMAAPGLSEAYNETNMAMHRDIRAVIDLSSAGRSLREAKK